MVFYSVCEPLRMPELDKVIAMGLALIVIDAAAIVIQDHVPQPVRFAISCDFSSSTFDCIPSRNGRLPQGSRPLFLLTRVVILFTFAPKPQRRYPCCRD